MNSNKRHLVKSQSNIWDDFKNHDLCSDFSQIWSTQQLNFYNALIFMNVQDKEFHLMKPSTNKRLTVFAIRRIKIPIRRRNYKSKGPSVCCMNDNRHCCCICVFGVCIVCLHARTRLSIVNTYIAFESSGIRYNQPKQ